MVLSDRYRVNGCSTVGRTVELVLLVGLVMDLLTGLFLASSPIVSSLFLRWYFHAFLMGVCFMVTYFCSVETPLGY